MNNKGFTLIELILVLLILATILLLILPGNNFIDKGLMIIDIKRMERDILYYRNKAMAAGANYDINFVPVENKYVIRSETKEVKEVFFKSSLKVRGGSMDKIKWTKNGTPSIATTISFNYKDERISLKARPVVGKIRFERNKLGGKIE